MTVNRHTLIAPETELLAEQGWKFLNSQLSTAFDLAPAAGAWAIALAVSLSSARLSATDLSAEALEYGQAKCRRVIMSWSASNSCKEMFWRTGFAKGFDLIISNPPYIPTAEISDAHSRGSRFMTPS